jgi:hypothetical protein
MKPELHTAPNTRNALKFLVLKSYGGGKSWVRARLCHDFVAAANAAQLLRVEHPSIRFRVDVDPGWPAAQRRKSSPHS